MSGNQADLFFENGEYELAFNCYKEIAEDDSENIVDRSNAFAMLGMIIFNIIDVEDGQAGLNYFRRSIELKPDNVGALLNIIQTFSPGDHTYHSDKTLFIHAFNKLTTDLRNELTDRMLSEVLNKYEDVKSYL